MTSTDSTTQTGISSKSKEGHPPMYKVLLHNDNYTTIEFVVEILVNVFGKSLEKANQIMLNVHNKGREVCGVYPLEIAETKIQTVHNLASNKGFPLKSTMEKE
ncbi:MAG: ATP-dependent Clp protease adaptor ClpS [Desulfobacula sp.]|nr:ATP-dependent Clp protease adaptor ClpS [Desulfobacula sp.]